MCGLCGIYSLEPGPLPPAIAAALPAMTRAIAHRGPDAQGVWLGERCGLGHRRLSIIDRAGGDQPIENEDGTVRIVFNGEVYNHRELRRELEARGHRFRTRSDTEAILHGYEEWGERCVERLEGMFAFVIHDARKDELFIARDRLGKKPLFYAELGGVLHFASEIKSFYPSPAWDGAVDLSALEGYLSLGYFLAPSTVYRRVRRLEAASWLRVRGDRIETRRYWDVTRFEDDARPVEEIRAELDASLRARVVERLESEVPLGAFLSGGIDSGIVVSYMAEAHKEPVVTTTIGFDDPAHDEVDAATLTARRFGTRHHVERVRPDLEEVLDPIVSAFDEPFADSSAIPTYYVSKMTRRHVTVALSGDGGDESFGGYDFRYVPHAIEEAARSAVPARAARWLGARWPRSPRLPKPLRIGTLLENLGRDPADAYYADLCFLKPGATRRLLGRPADPDPRASPVYEAVAGPYRRCPAKSAVMRAQYADLMVYLPNDVLVKVDRMSMQHALEVRCPLLDRRIVELAFRVPTEVKMPRWKPKHLLRSVGKDRLPPELLTMPKHGFTVPIGRWIAGPYAGRYETDVLGQASPLASWLNLEVARELFLAHRRGAADHSYALWALWVLERWATARR